MTGLEWDLMNLLNPPETQFQLGWLARTMEEYKNKRLKLGTGRSQWRGDYDEHLFKLCQDVLDGGRNLPKQPSSVRDHALKVRTKP